MKALHSAAATGIGYNPGTQYIGGQLLAQGINQAGNALAEGLQQYAKNREEASALDIAFDTRAKPIITDLQKFAAQNGQLDPAAEALVDKGAKWHTLGSSQKKQVLADVVLLGDRREKERLQAETKARNEALLKLQQEQLGVSRQGMALEAMRTLSGMFNQSRDNARADRALGLQEQQLTAALEAQRAKANQLEKDRAAYQALLRFNQPLESNQQGPQPTFQFNAARAMQQTGGQVDAETLAALNKLSAPRAVPGTLNPIPGAPGYGFLVQSETGSGSAIPLPAPSGPPAPMPDVPGFTPVPTGDKGRITWLKTGTPEGATPDRETLGRIAQLEEMLRQKGGQDFAFDYDKAAGYSPSRFWDDGKSAKAELARLRGMVGGSATPAAGAAPASASSSKLIEEANEAIRRGADPEKVKARLKQLGVTVQ